MTHQPLRLEDDELSHQPDFSFRKPKPPTKFAFDQASTVDLDAVAKLSPLAAPAAPATQPVQVVAEPPAAPEVITAPTPVMPASQAPVTAPSIPIVQVQPAPFSGTSLAAFILSLIGIIAPFFFLPAIFSVLAIILGHVGSYRSRRRGLNGAGFAAAGLTIGYATLAITALVVIVVVIIGVLTGNVIGWLNATFSR